MSRPFVTKVQTRRKQTDWLGNGMTVNDLLELKRGGPLVAESCPITRIR
jgi:hypothetical protein